MTEREIQLVAELESETARNRKIINLIKKRQENLKKSDIKIAELGLAIKEEQLNSIRETVNKQGIDFDTFRAALEQGLLTNMKFNLKENSTKNEQEVTADKEMTDNEND